MSQKPTTQAGRADHDYSWPTTRRRRAEKSIGRHEWSREGCRACERIAAIEAEARAKAESILREDRLNAERAIRDRDATIAALHGALDGWVRWHASTGDRLGACSRCADTLRVLADTAAAAEEHDKQIVAEADAAYMRLLQEATRRNDAANDTIAALREALALDHPHRPPTLPNCATCRLLADTAAAAEDGRAGT